MAFEGVRGKNGFFMVGMAFLLVFLMILGARYRLFCHSFFLFNIAVNRHFYRRLR